MKSIANKPTRRRVEERIKDWFEIYEPFPEEKQREQGARCMDCGVPFCHTGCPVNNLIPDWNDLVYNSTLGERDPPAACDQQLSGIYGAHLPCAVRGGLRAGHQSAAGFDQADREEHRGARVGRGLDSPEPPEQNTGKRVAVVGSGPAGLAAAQQLRRAGHSVTVYEKNDRIGGLLRYGIPNFKLEKHVIDRRLKQMRAEGVTFVTNAHVGVNVPVDTLTEPVRCDPAGRRARNIRAT